jgi:nitric oxide reductase activation protein
MKNTLKNAFPIVAAALGNKFGVKVSVGGQDAYTDGDRINLPALDVDDDSELRDVAWGYLAHEAAHVRFTDFIDFRNAVTSPIRKSVVNILEDVRIEKSIQQAYPGTKRTTEKVVIHLIETNGFELVSNTDNPHPAAVLTQFLLFRLRHDVLGQTALNAYADSAEALLEATFPAGAVTRLFGLLSEVPSLVYTRDCIRLADQILRMIQEEQEKAELQASQQPEQSGGNDSDSQPKQSQSDQDQELTDDAGDSQQNDPLQSADPQSNQSNATDGQGDDDQVRLNGARDSQQGNPSDADDQPSNQNNDPVHLSEDSDQGDQEQKSGQGSHFPENGSTDQSQSAQLAQMLSSVLSAGEEDLPDDVFEVVQEILGSQPKNSYDADIHMPLAMEPHRNDSIGQAILSKALAESGKIRASLQGLIQSSRRDRSVHKRSGNRIDGRKLSRLAQGDSRIFQRRTHHQAPNTALHLLVDGSGSMHGYADPNSRTRLIDLAIESAVALALALEGISGVNPAITRFPHGDSDDVTPLLRHGQKVRPNASAFSSITDGGTPLHTALWYAAASVLATREERKVIMVLTDGQPDDYHNGCLLTKAIIQRCINSGIELVGVGICIDVSHLFPQSICINDVSELRSELFGISRDLLLAA